jgi:hypothetical protein
MYIIILSDVKAGDVRSLPNGISPRFTALLSVRLSHCPAEKKEVAKMSTKKNAEISKDTSIEDMTNRKPQSVAYLMKEGIRCIRCGDPIWGTLESAAKEKGFSDEDVKRFVREINEL